MLKENLLSELEQNRDKVLSGQYLADLFSVSRNAIWKAIKALREEGHEIESLPQKGYRLNKSSDVLSKEGIVKFLKCDSNKVPEIFVYQELDSTNNEAKRLLAEADSSNFIVVAKEQTQGRGRRGHSFFSPADTGLYMSVVFKPDFELNQALLITTAAAVAIVRAVRNLTGKQLEIKWVNDLFYNEKKVCGILTEAITDFESGDVSDIIIGIGLNISTAVFPEDIEDIAGSLEENNITKNEFAASIFTELLYVYEHIEEQLILEEYRLNSMVICKKIYIENGSETKTALAIDIDKDGSLICKDDKENKFNLRSGSISILK